MPRLGKTAASVTPDQVTEALHGVEEPELERSLGELGLVRSVTVDKGAVHATVAEIVEGAPESPELVRRVREAVQDLGDVRQVEVDLDPLSESEQQALREHLVGDPAATAGSEPAHGHAEGRAIPFADPGSTTRVLLIASGKGGVGKSSITTNLAVALADRGHRTAVVDADVWGFSIPHMLGVPRPPVVMDTLLIPPKVNGVRCISMGFFAHDDQPVIWRGPMLHKALEQFLTDVWWDEPDFLVVDLPPGTGDISLSLAQFLPRSEVFVVTTPQAAAQRVAQRAGLMAEKVSLEVRGVIENMSWFTGDDGTRYEIFGSGGGQALADRLGVPLVGQVPLIPELRAGSDLGQPIVATDPDSEAGKAFAVLAERLDTELVPTKRYHPDLKIV